MRKERYCLVGTAPSWQRTPWHDKGLWIGSLNDAYQMKDFGRFDEWTDFHPLDHFYHPPKDAKGVYAHQVPAGYYVRPADHLLWLKQTAQTKRVWLHPDYLTQHPDAATWPEARPFPKAEIEAAFGRYFTSSPSWMLAQAVLEGAREIHIYGIHLSTEHEYVEQRPGFEFLIGRVLGPSKLTTTVKDGLRRYETQDGIVVLPEASPVLSSNFQYAFEPRPRAKLEPLKWDVHRYAIKRERAVKALQTAPWYARTAALQDELWRADAYLADAQDQLARVELVQQMGAH